MAAGIEPVPAWKRVFPPAVWLAEYRAADLPRDLVAGITLAAFAIPVSLAYASLAGLPPEVGIYGYMLGGLGYALFGSSRQLAVGPTSAISLMVGSTIAQIPGAQETGFGAIAMHAAFVLAALCVIAWLLRLSTLTSFISETILLGFKAGAGLSIASTQLPAFFGIAGGGDHFFARVATIAAQIPGLNVVATTVGVVALVLLVAGERFLPGRPIALVVVAMSIAAVSFSPALREDLTLVGHIPPHLPSLGVPFLRPSEIDGLIPLAFACLLLAYIEGVSAARTLATKNGYAIDVRQELLGLGGANLLAALGGGYPVAGGLSQSAVNDKAGAKTPLALVFASIALAGSVVFLAGLAGDLPKAVLSAIVLVAVRGLIDFQEMRRLWRANRLEFTIATVAFAGVLIEGILRGVLLAAFASILLLIARTANPHVAFLGRIPGTRRFSDLARHADNEKIDGVLALRVESSLLYFNVEHVETTVLACLDDLGERVRLVIWDLSTSPYVDLAGARMIESFADILTKRGIEMRLVEAHGPVRDLLRTEGVDERIAGVNRYSSIADEVDAWLKKSTSGAD